MDFQQMFIHDLFCYHYYDLINITGIVGFSNILYIYIYTIFMYDVCNKVNLIWPECFQNDRHHISWIWTSKIYKSNLLNIDFNLNIYLNLIHGYSFDAMHTKYIHKHLSNIELHFWFVCIYILLYTLLIQIDHKIFKNKFSNSETYLYVCLHYSVYTNRHFELD